MTRFDVRIGTNNTVTIEANRFEVTPSGVALFYGRVAGSSSEVTHALSPSMWETVVRRNDSGGA